MPPVNKTLLFIFSFFLLQGPVQAATVREMYEQAVDAYNKQDFDRSIGLYQEIIKEAPHFAPAYVGVGLSLKGKGADVDEVLYYYKTATTMDPTNVQAFEQLGRLYYSLNKFDKAEQSFLKALKIDPGLLSAKASLAWIYLLGRPKPELAVRYFKDVVKASPTPNVYLGLGMAYFANNDRVNAIDIITQLHKMGEEDFAKRLETMVRENQKVAVTPAEDAPAPQEKTVEDAPSAGIQETGMKVRLRGKLSDVN